MCALIQLPLGVQWKMACPLMYRKNGLHSGNNTPLLPHSKASTGNTEAEGGENFIENGSYQPKEQQVTFNLMLLGLAKEYIKKGRGGKLFIEREPLKEGVCRPTQII